MELGSLKKIPPTPAAELCAGMPVEESVADLTGKHAEPRELLEALLTGGRNLDALRFLVCCLPPREVVWLGCLATQNARERVPLTEENAAALGAAEQWVYHPEEEHRHAARVASERGDSGSPASLTALAVYYTGGSIGPENGPEVPPPPGLAARLVESALIVACTDDDPDRSALHVRTLLEQALDIAGGGSGRRHEQSS